MMVVSHGNAPTSRTPLAKRSSWWQWTNQVLIHPQNRRLIYGRRQGHRLHPAQARRVTEILPEFEPKLSAPDISGWFGTRAPEMGFDTYALEIGFGGGEHLAACAKAAPQTGFIGCEPFINGVAKLLGHIEAGGLENLCVHHGDARDVMAAMPAGVLDQVFLLYPDPWPKKRHHKRRFVNQENLDSLFRVLAPMPGCWWQPILQLMPTGHWPR